MEVVACCYEDGEGRQMLEKAGVRTTRLDLTKRESILAVGDLVATQFKSQGMFPVPK